MTSLIYDFSDEQLKDFLSGVQTKGWGLLHDQDLSEDRMASLFRRIGVCETPDLFMNHKKNPEIFEVSDKKDSNGNKTGMFGGGELGWHSNGNSRHLNDKILIGLYCVEGNENTTLSMCNTTDPFLSLSDEEREYWKTIKIKIKFQNHTMYSLEEDDPELEFMNKNRGSIRELVGIHPHNHQPYFYFPYHFIVGAWEGKKKINHEEMIERLKLIIFKSKYQQHHVFQHGDLMLMDQFTSLHRRTPVGGDRLLWRTACDYSNT